MRTLSSLPKPAAELSKLFVTGATVGPLVDSLHNQCLLEYNIAPITIFNPFTTSLSSESGPADPILCTSWLIPPLLGIAYVVLGGILPRLVQNAVVSPLLQQGKSSGGNLRPGDASIQHLRTKAFIAVITTGLIIKLSEQLQTQAITLPDGTVPDSGQSISIMLVAALGQWLVLDTTPAALIAAAITSIGGPLSELPFVAAGAWEYIPSAADYFPLSSLPTNGVLDELASAILGDGYRDLALSSITGPCYFAVTMDSIALGRWFSAQEAEEDQTLIR